MFKPNRLVEARKNRDLTRTDLIFALDRVGLRISPPTLFRWETGLSAPDVNEIAVLAKFFNKSVGYFFGKKHDISGYVKATGASDRDR